MDIWCDCLREIWPLQKNDELGTVLSIARQKGDVEESIEARIISAKLLGCFMDVPVDTYRLGIYAAIYTAVDTKL